VAAGVSAHDGQLLSSLRVYVCLPAGLVTGNILSIRSMPAGTDAGVRAQLRPGTAVGVPSIFPPPDARPRGTGQDG
jgi:hypothetical protein